MGVAAPLARGERTALNPPCGTILPMEQLVRFGVHLIGTLFFLGLLGSLAVVLLSSVGDVQDLFLRRNDRPEDRA